MKTKSIIYSAAVLSVAFVSCQKETVKQDNADCAIVASFDINNIESRADASELSDFYLYIDQPVGTDYYVVLSKGDGSEWKAYQCDVSGNITTTEQTVLLTDDVANIKAVAFDIEDMVVTKEQCLSSVTLSRESSVSPDNAFNKDIIYASTSEVDVQQDGNVGDETGTPADNSGIITISAEGVITISMEHLLGKFSVECPGLPEENSITALSLSSAKVIQSWKPSVNEFVLSDEAVEVDLNIESKSFYLHPQTIENAVVEMTVSASELTVSDGTDVSEEIYSASLGTVVIKRNVESKFTLNY